MSHKLNSKQIEIFKKEETQRYKKVTNESLLKLIDFFEQGFSPFFIVNYRKDKIDGLSETMVFRIKEDYSDFKNILNCQEHILETLKESQTLDSEIEERVLSLFDRFLLEEYFLSIKPNRKTRATNARQLGLQELSNFIKEQTTKINIQKKLESFVDPQKGVSTEIVAKEGAFDIIAEEIANDLKNKQEILDYECKQSLLETKNISESKIEDIQKNTQKGFQKYLKFSSKLGLLSAFQALQIFRAKKLKLIHVNIKMNDEKHLLNLTQKYVKDNGVFSKELTDVVKDAYTRLIKPIIEIELYSRFKKKAQKMALNEIQNKAKFIFYSKSIVGKVVMGIYPGTDSGCKIALINSDGNLLEQRVIFIQQEESKVILTAMVETFKVQVIGIADDRGAQKCSQFVQSCAASLESFPVWFFMSKLGAIAYASSSFSEQEFPVVEKILRRAIFIARQIQDPLNLYANLDYYLFGLMPPQYENWNSSVVKQKIDQVLGGAIHFFGVDVNRCSASILKQVSGINSKLADEIIAYRKKNGFIQTRADLSRISRFDPSSFKQASGFLRIENGSNPLDATSIHPEQYEKVEHIFNENKLTLDEVIKEPRKLKKIKWENFSDDTNKLLIQDLRKKVEWLVFSKERDILEKYRLKNQDISNIKPDQVCKAIVISVASFGVFVDIGVHKKAFIHVSDLSKSYLSKLEVIKARFLEHNVETKKISFSMKEVNQQFSSNFKANSKTHFKQSKKLSKKHPNRPYTLQELQEKFKYKGEVKKNNVGLKVSIKAIMKSGR